MIELSVRQKIKGKILEYKISLPILSGTLVIMFWLTKKFAFLHSEVFQTWLKHNIQLILFAIFLLIIFLSISFVYIYSQNRKIKELKRQIEKLKEFSLIYGVYWDKDLNPHCPVCKIPLSNTAEFEQKYYSDAYCHNCNKGIPIYNDEGQLTISEARELIRKGLRVKEIDIPEPNDIE